MSEAQRIIQEEKNRLLKLKCEYNKAILKEKSLVIKEAYHHVVKAINQELDDIEIVFGTQSEIRQGLNK